MSKVKERIGRAEKARERRMWLVFSRIIFKLPCSFLLGVVTSLLLVGLDGFADLMVLVPPELVLNLT